MWYGMCSFNLGYVFTDDVTGMKGPSSSINSQNGTCHDKKAATGVVPQSSLSQKIQLTENDNIPEEVSLFISKSSMALNFSLKK